MFLTKDGITIELVHPAEIARYKQIGYVEAKAPIASEPEAPEKTPEDQNAEAIHAVNTSQGIPTAKAKGKVKDGDA